MRKIVTLFSIVLILFIGDNSIIPFLAIKGFSPSLLFVFIVSYSIINGSWEGLWLGVFAGLLQDVYFSNVLGINALTNMLSCVIAGYVGINIFKEKILIPVATSFLLSIFKGILVFMLLYIVSVNMPLRNIVFNSLYNMLVSIPMYKFVFNLCNKDYMERKWKF
ncbi:rod shape-determining protein MreD [Clostridium sp. MSJ-11]|uniref:Rod shape-determining protein MreD n=1 Tax=Clostridium mobile TaxID=2841512 RepID=A0ABS6EEC8_9CLOT|nr:rod shape-determining protein MreD [Clostridium mobile]MBU5483570.1 rod shape-determining protein MreD [Clostridium mobile]